MNSLLFTFLVAMTPVIELRGAIPLAVARGVPPLSAACAAVLGNLLPVPFILLFIRRTLDWLNARSARCRRLALKNLVARSRPCWLRPDVPLLIPLPTDYSFPSGHTLASVIGASCLARADRRFCFAAIALAALIALSRLYLFVHFPSDVLASVVLGLAIAAGANRAFRLRAAERSAG